jgi:hypothetical protein
MRVYRLRHNDLLWLLIHQLNLGLHTLIDVLHLRLQLRMELQLGMRLVHHLQFFK